MGPAWLSSILMSLAGLVLHSQADQPAFASPGCADTEIIAFEGLITAETVAPLLEALERCRVHTVRIASEGGAVTQAIRLAEAVRASDATLVIHDRCLSSCANYLFLGVPRRSIDGRTVLGFHGFISDVSAPPGWASSLLCGVGVCAVKRKREAVLALQAREAAFFESIGVDPSHLGEAVIHALQRGSGSRAPDGPVVVRPEADAWRRCFGDTPGLDDLVHSGADPDGRALSVVETRGPLCSRASGEGRP